MVAPEHDDSVFGESEPLELVEDLADLRVGITHTRVIAADEIQSGRISDGTLLRNTLIVSRFAPIVMGFRGGVGGHLVVVGQRDGFRRIKIPILLRRDKREVRFVESYRKEEGLIGVGRQFL